MRPVSILLILAVAGGALLAAPSPDGTASGNGRGGASLSAADLSWLSPWGYRVRLTVSPDSLGGPGDLQDFPIALTLNAAQSFIFDHAKADGSDLRVTKADGLTLLPREIIRFDPGSDRAELWFRADVLSPSEHEFYLYYGNPAASAPAADGTVWHSDYAAVYHFSENPGNQVLKDFGPRGNDAAAGYQSVWTPSDVIDGVVGQAWDFDGITHFIDADAISTQDSSFVISSWAMLNSRSTDFAFQANPGFWHVSFQINETHYAPHYAIANPIRDLRWTPNPLPLDGKFHNFTWVFDGVADTIFFYYDGIQQPAYPHRLTAPAQHFYTGHPINPAGNGGVGVAGPMSLNDFDILNGAADEFRVREGTLPASWILTEVRNQRSPQGFLSVGPQETPGPVPVRLLRFDAVREALRVVVRWDLTSDSEPDGEFRLYREAGNGEPVPVTANPLRESLSYTLIDEEAPAHAFRYRLDELTRTGETIPLGAAQVEAASGARLGLTAPNPLRGEANLRFSTARAGALRLVVIDAAGREVSRIVDGDFPAGDHELRWDARGSDGMPLSPGVYFFRLETADGNRSRKFLMLR